MVIEVRKWLCWGRVGGMAGKELRGPLWDGRNVPHLVSGGDHAGICGHQNH